MTKSSKNVFRFSRRRWLGLTFFGGAGLVITRPILQGQPDQIIATILRHRLSPAQIPDDTYQSFLEVLQATEYYYDYLKAYKALSAVAWLYPTGILHRIPTLKTKLHHIEELVITHFTMSTNFFLNEQTQNGEQPLEFISYWRERACNNSFATFDKV